MKYYGTVFDGQQKADKKIYHLVPYQIRKALIDQVISKGLSVYRASQLLQIKNTTAKAIIRRYRREGVIFCRKRQRQPQERPLVKTESTSMEEDGPEVKVQNTDLEDNQTFPKFTTKEEYESEINQNMQFPFVQNYGVAFLYYFDV